MNGKFLKKHEYNKLKLYIIINILFLTYISPKYSLLLLGTKKVLN